MPQGQVRDGHVVAESKTDHVGVAGHGRHGGGPIRFGPADRQVVYAADHQLRSVVAGLPAVVQALVAAVVGGIRQAEALTYHDGPIGADGGQELVRIGHGDLSARGHRRGLLQGGDLHIGVLDGSDLHGRQVDRRKLVPIRAQGGEGAVPEPGVQVIAVEGAAAHDGGDATQREGALQRVILHLVGQEAGVAGVVAFEQRISAVVVDPAVGHSEAVPAVGLEQAGGGGIVLPAVVVDLRVQHLHVPAAVRVHGAVAALIDPAAGDGHIAAVHGPYARGAAAEQAAAFHRHRAAVHEMQHAA